MQRVELVCVVCGERFVLSRPSEAKRRRTCSQTCATVRKRQYGHEWAKWVPPCSEARLRALYVGRRLTTSEIAAELGVGKRRVKTALRRFGIRAPKLGTRHDRKGAANPAWRGGTPEYEARRITRPLDIGYRYIVLRDPCCYCGSRRRPEADHIIPVVRGGLPGWENLTASCRDCNRRKWAKSLLRFLLDHRGPDEVPEQVSLL